MLPLGEIFLAAVEVYHNNWIKETLIVGILHEKYKMRYPPPSRIHISPIDLTQNTFIYTDSILYYIMLTGNAEAPNCFTGVMC